MHDFEQFEKDKIFKPVHRGLLSITASARLAAVGSFNITTSVFFLSMLRLAAKKSIIDMGKMLPYLKLIITGFLNMWFLLGICIML